jgi:hypothetical protein
MIRDARPAVGSSIEHSSQAAGSNAPVSSTGGGTVALVQARSSHRCLGAGRDAGRCPVQIPLDRDLCQYCQRTRYWQRTLDLGDNA